MIRGMGVVFGDRRTPLNPTETLGFGMNPFQYERDTMGYQALVTKCWLPSAGPQERPFGDRFLHLLTPCPNRRTIPPCQTPQYLQSVFSG